MQMLITCKKSTIMGSSRDRIWPSDEKRQDLKVNNHNTHYERFLIFCLFSDFVVCLLLQISFFQEPFSKMSSWQTASFTWQGNDNAQLHTSGSRKLVIPRSAFSEQILRHFNEQLETRLPSNGWPLLQNEAKTMSGTRVENIVALSLSQTKKFVLIDIGSSLFDVHVHVNVCVFIKWARFFEGKPTEN